VGLGTSYPAAIRAHQFSSSGGLAGTLPCRVTTMAMGRRTLPSGGPRAGLGTSFPHRLPEPLRPPNGGRAAMFRSRSRSESEAPTQASASGNDSVWARVGLAHIQTAFFARLQDVGSVLLADWNFTTLRSSGTMLKRISSPSVGNATVRSIPKDVCSVCPPFFLRKTASWTLS
jgi:hypothetical protein